MSGRSLPNSRQLSPTRAPLRSAGPSQIDLTLTEVIDPTEHPALNAGNTAVITGAASGIGLAAALQLAG